MNESNPFLFSFIVPVYNAESYLNRCVDSILNQSYSNLELFLVDDGSTDQSLQICNQYAQKDGRISVIHQENKGQGAARNAALEKVNGDYILFIDADDAIYLDTLKEHIDILSKNETIDFIQFPIHHFYNSPKSFVKSPIPSFYQKADDFILLTLQENKISWIVCDKIFSSKIWRNLRFREDMKYEDNYLIMNLLPTLNEVYLSDKGLYYYYHNENSTTTSELTYLKEWSTLQVLKVTLEMLQNHNQYLPLFYKYLIRWINVEKSMRYHFNQSVDYFKMFKNKVKWHALLSLDLMNKDRMKLIQYKYF